MTFTRTYDCDLVKGIMTHPAVWRRIGGGRDTATCQPIEHEALWYVLVREDDGKLMGLFVLEERISGWELHACLLPKVRGRTVRAFREFFAWVWRHTACHCLVATVPRRHLAALQRARAAGMEENGVRRAAWKRKDGVEDLVLFGLPRPGGVTVCQQN